MHASAFAFRLYACVVSRHPSVSSTALSVKLFSKDETFFDYFRQLAEHIGRAAILLKTLLENPGNAGTLAAEIKRVETDGDAIVHVINQRIDTSFVTPLDREDIHQLASRLDNVIDLINSAARAVVMFRVTEPRDGAVQLADVIVRASTEIFESVVDVTKPKRMSGHSRAIKMLEEEGDALYGECVGALFAGELAAIEVIKWKDIFDALEAAIDECEDVSNVLESIALKNS